MLTGDMGQTAEEIGFNCGVMSRDPQVNTIIRLAGTDKSELSEMVKQAVKDVEQARREGKKVCVLVGGDTFHVAERLEDNLLMQFKKDILLASDSVILYRSSPNQKAVVTKMVRELTNQAMVLGVGDGFNDINMIQSAHIGIGIQGKESNQAAAFADYAIV